VTLHLHAVNTPVADDAVKPLFAVVQRRNGDWSPDARIIALFDREAEAELFATEYGRTHPHLRFGIWQLRSEARLVEKPVQVVRAGDE